MAHEFEGEAFTGATDTIEAAITGAEWDGWPLKIMTVENLLEQDGLCNYVWPHEGQFTEAGKWKFHKGKVMDGSTEIDAPTGPLMVDIQSAHAFKLVWNAINEKNQAKTREFVASRGLFVWAMDTLVWPNVKFGG